MEKTLRALINPIRLGCENSGTDWTDLECRSEYQRDYDRIAFSRTFRRLQGKTQVFPAPNDERVHNRLTHSVEAACVGRYLGTKAAIGLGLKAIANDIGSVVSAAALAHDIGNPPYGHSGEKAIQGFFKSDRGRELLSRLNEEEGDDFREFDGNQMAFRIMTHSLPEKTKAPGGMKLTYATLAASVKYSCCNASRKGASFPKAGLFVGQLPTFATIARSLSLPERGDKAWARHPLAFLVEAADDIAYRVSDAEDGCKRGLLSKERLKKRFRNIVRTAPRFDEGELNKALARISDPLEQIGFLRAKVINSLIEQAAGAFVKNATKIVEGKYHEELLANIPAEQEVKELKRDNEKIIYSHHSVVEIEAAGFSVLPELLYAYMDSVVSHKHPEKAKKIRQTLPSEVASPPMGTGEYERLMRVLVYVVGMTDRFATLAYRTLLGTHLPEF